MREYWGRAVGWAWAHALPRSFREVATSASAWIVAILVLRFVIEGEWSQQVTEEVRWGLSVFGAFVVLVIGTFLVHLVAAPPALELAAVQAGISADRSRRLHATVRALDRRINDGVQLRSRIDFPNDATRQEEGRSWIRDLARWQRSCRGTVRHCRPDQFAMFQANVGNDVRFHESLADDWMPRGQFKDQAAHVIQEWLHALGEVRDAATK